MEQRARVETHLVRVRTDDAGLEGVLTLPNGCGSVAVFSLGAGGTRHEPTYRYVADVLQSTGIGTLLVDLLTPEEAAIDLRTAEFRWDVARLARRTIASVDWLARHPQVRGMRIGLLGPGAGAAAALVAAAHRPEHIGAVVSCAGRPDLADDRIEAVRAPMLFLVRDDDPETLGAHRVAQSRARTSCQLEAIGTGATWSGPALERLGQVTTRFLRAHLAPAVENHARA